MREFLLLPLIAALALVARVILMPALLLLGRCSPVSNEPERRA